MFSSAGLTGWQTFAYSSTIFLSANIYQIHFSLDAFLFLSPNHKFLLKLLNTIRCLCTGTLEAQLEEAGNKSAYASSTITEIFFLSAACMMRSSIVGSQTCHVGLLGLLRYTTAIEESCSIACKICSPGRPCSQDIHRYLPPDSTYSSGKE